ncbi:uncharacterized protein LOC106074402 isoform X3 [Biomphalaria glabrata]|uniref:Uncharacterized protein LOC106074402 isoform X3 n=1 Tax=Biomphalaria glabrata TaxID=6526 RepID=A0A9W3B6X4_BIOGL|nr:uncharacterized protein LOC106074402 isoform X3 [Biomphalaria glabrata]
MARSNIRYEVLPSEEQNVPAEPVSMAMVIAPPGYAESAVLEHQGDIPAYGPAKLPNYEDATTLPSYEEAERSKLEQDISNGASALTDCEGGRVTLAPWSQIEVHRLNPPSSATICLLSVNIILCSRQSPAPPELLTENWCQKCDTVTTCLQTHSEYSAIRTGELTEILC